MDKLYKYFAFISYSSKDTKWGKKMQKKLEGYRMPATLCNEYGWKRKPMDPIFFAPTDIQTGPLTEEIQERLRASRHLIVICSPNSAQSEWVGREIEFFHNFGRTKNIHFFIIKGMPNSGNPETECFNPVVERLGLPEILGANIHEKNYRWPWLNKERAYVQLISKLLGVEFDTIWRRHKRLLIRRITVWTLGSVAVITAMINIGKNANQPFNVQIRLRETSFHNDQLPPLKDAKVTMILDNEEKSGIVGSLDSNLVFANIPHRLLNKQARFVATCKDFMDIDTVVMLNQVVELNIRRNPTVYGDIHFWLWNLETEKAMPNETVYVDGWETSSGADGRVLLFIPLEKQKKVYPVVASIPLAFDSIIMPLAEDASVPIK